MTEKRCSQCGIIKPVRGFSRDKTGKYGRRANCKVCQNIQTKECRHNKKTNATTEHADSHCCWCRIILTPERIASEKARIKQLILQYGGEQNIPLKFPTMHHCDECHWRTPQQRAEIQLFNRQTPRQGGMPLNMIPLNQRQGVLDSLDKQNRPAPPAPPESR